MDPAYKDKNIMLFKGDSFEIMPKFPKESFNSIMTDPPYFLSNDGITCKNGKVASVNKGDWDKLDSNITAEEFYCKFLLESKRLLKPDGTICVFGTMHNIYILGFLLQKLDFKILNNITWEKTNPAPNMSRRMFTHSTETIIWARKSKDAKHYFNYDLMRSINNNKQMKDVWSSSTTSMTEKRCGKHPTQKPLWLMERLILATTKEKDLILDCFSGSGTTLLASNKLNRRAIGIELEEEYIDLSIRRLNEGKINIKNE